MPKTTPGISQGTQELRSIGEGGPQYLEMDAQDPPPTHTSRVIGPYLLQEPGRWGLESCLSNKNDTNSILNLPCARYIIPITTV